MSDLSTLPELIQRRVHTHRDSVVLFDADRDLPLTYGQLDAENRRWAVALRSRGVTMGENVATMLAASFDAYHVWLGLAHLGAVEVPINSQLRGRTLAYLINHSDAAVMLVDELFLSSISDVAEQLTALKTVVLSSPAAPAGMQIGNGIAVVTREEFFAGADPASLLPVIARRSDTACVIYTSGTTGPPKGVVIPWGWLVGHEINERRETGSRYSYLSPAHMSGKNVLFQAVAENRPLILRATFSVTGFWDDIERYDCRATQLWPGLIKFLLAKPKRPEDHSTPLAHVWCAPLTADIDEFADRFGVEVTTGFGMTEIGGPIGAQYVPGSDWRSSGKLVDGPQGYEVRIVNEYDEPLGPNEVGELIVRTALPWSINVGYFGQPEATAAAWRNGWFHTGDALRYDEDGNFYFVDRFKDCIRRRGENISSFEVESYVLEHPAVSECAAIGIPSDDGEQDVQICVVLRDGSDITAHDLSDHFAESMPRFMIPRFVAILPSLPKTSATGRIQKAELRKGVAIDSLWDRELPNGDRAPAEAERTR